METETTEKSSEFRHCVLARTQQKKKKNSTTRRSFEYANDNDAYRGVKTSKYQLPRKDITSQTHDISGWTNDPAERNEEPPD